MDGWGTLLGTGTSLPSHLGPQPQEGTEKNIFEIFWPESLGSPKHAGACLLPHGTWGIPVSLPPTSGPMEKIQSVFMIVACAGLYTVWF